MTCVSATLEVHVIGLGRHHAIEMTGVELDLFVEAFSVGHFDRPPLVELGHQVVALEVVDAVALPALVQFVTESGCLLTFDLARPLEVPSNQLLVNYFFRGVAHFINLIIINAFQSRPASLGYPTRSDDWCPCSVLRRINKSLCV